MLVHALLGAMTLWLLIIAKSATSLSCVVLAVGILLAMRFPAMTNAFRRLGLFGFVIVPLLVLFLHEMFDLGGMFVGTMGRDLTLTGRTEIWKRCLQVGVNPLIGTGYSSFWAGDRVESVSEGFYFRLQEAHNGYLDTYLNSGLLGLFLLGAVLASGAKRISQRVANGDSYDTLRISFLVVAAIYNLTESAFNGLVLMWFVLLLAIVEYPCNRRVAVKSGEERLRGSGNVARTQNALAGLSRSITAT